MMSVQTCTAAMAQSYYEADNYYTRDAGLQDEWQGRLAKDLGIDGKTVEPAEFEAMLAQGDKCAAYDCTFSAPKSVSILAECGDPEQSADMLAAHREAVEATLKDMEAKEIGTRVRHPDGSRTWERTGNMSAAKFEHNVSREADPQLHTHTVILNRTDYAGEMYAIDGRRLFATQKIYGAEYRARLAENLMQRGYSIHVTDHENGFFELDGIEQKTLDHFSKRRAEILAEMEKNGEHGAAAAQRANLATRHAKEHIDINEKRAEWRAELAEMQQDLPHRQELKPADFAAERQAAYADAVHELQYKSFAFTQKELEEAVIQRGVSCGMTRDRAQQLINSDRDLFKATTPPDLVEAKEGTIYYTTRHNLEQEADIYRMCEGGKNKLHGLSREQVSRSISEVEASPEWAGKGWKLKEEQSNLVHHIAESNDRVIAVRGLAGTGKSFSLNAAREVLERNGYEVRGMAASGQAAQELAEDANIKTCTTIHKALNSAEKEAGNAVPGEDYSTKHEWNFDGLQPSAKPRVYFMDEASLTDNNTLFHTLKMLEKDPQAKLVLVGDDKQLPPVGAGNAFSDLVQQNKLSVCTLADIQRQKDNPELLETVKQIVNGDPETALDRLSGDITEIKTHAARMRAVSKSYTDLSPEEQQKTIVLTATNADRKELNNRIRTQLIKQGQLQQGSSYAVMPNKDAAAIEQRNFAPGDKIIFLKNDNALDVRNGTKGVIREINGNVFTVDCGHKEPVTFDIGKYTSVDHGYVLSTYKSQGMTVQRSIINLDSKNMGLNTRNSFYVNVSRAKTEVKIFADSREKLNPQLSKFAEKVSTRNMQFAPQKGAGKAFDAPLKEMGQPAKAAAKTASRVADKAFSATTKAAATAMRAAGMVLDGAASVLSFVPVVGSLASAVVKAPAGLLKGGAKCVDALDNARKNLHKGMDKALDAGFDVAKEAGRTAWTFTKQTAQVGKTAVETVGKIAQKAAEKEKHQEREYEFEM